MRHSLHLFFLFIGLYVVNASVNAQKYNRPNFIAPNGFEVNSYTGNLYYSRTDIKEPGQGLNIDITFSYNISRTPKNWGMGNGWTFSYNMAYTPDSLGIWIERADGSRDLFKKNGNSYTPPVGVYDSLVQYQAGAFYLLTKQGTKYYFNNATHKRLTGITDRNNNSITLGYTDSMINTLADGAGHSFQFSWTNGSLTKITDNSCAQNRVVSYTYDTARNLIRATNPLGNFVSYYYDGNYRMTAFTDENGYNMSMVYNSSSAVKQIVSCITTQIFSYVAAEYKTYVTEMVNGQKQVTTYQYDSLGRLTNKIGNCCGFNISYAYDNKSNPVQLTDGMGTSTKYEYDNKGNITKKTYVDGTTETYTYNPVYNKVTSAKDRSGNSTSYQYDALGNAIQINKPLSVTEKYTYDTKGNPLSHMDGNGNASVYQYNSFGYLLKMTNPENGITQYSYDCHGNRLTQTDANSNTTTYEYNTQNQLTKITDALGNSSTYSYDKAGNLINTTDPLDKTTTYSYDGLGRRISTTSPLGITTQTLYDELGNVIKTIDGNGNATSYTYNSRKQIVTKTDALGKTINYSYDEAGNKTSVTDKMGNTTKMEYDENYRLKKSTNPAGNSISYTYDALGNRTTETDANGIITQYKYDTLNRTIKVIDALNNAINYTYDANGNQLTETDKKGNTTTYTYNKLNRVKTITDPLKAVTYYTYDADGNLLTETDPLNHTTTKTYDKLNHLLKEANPLNETTSYTYDAIGNVKTTTQPNGNIITNNYDGDSRLISINDVIGKVGSYTYDNNGNKLSEYDGNNNAINFGYDALNRQIQQTDALGKSSYYSFDANNNLLTETDRNGNAKRYHYDVLNNRITETDALGYTTRFIYDANNNRISIIDAKGNATLYTYNALDALTKETYSDNTTKEYTYDADDNRKTRKDNDGNITTYNYDAVNQLLQRSYSDGTSDNFTYDLAGRRLTANNANATITFTYDKDNRVLSETLNGKTITYSYNIATNNKTIIYPAGRKITETRDTRYRLVTVKEGSISIATYIYDIGNRLQQKTFENSYNEKYTYNSNDWLINLTCEPSNVINFTYTYDNEGNRLSIIKNQRPAYSEKYIYDKLYQVISFCTGKLTGTVLVDTISKSLYTYDALNNRTKSIEGNISRSYTVNRMNAYTSVLINGKQVNFTYDANGNILYDGENKYTYNEENKLIQISNTSTSEYFYDALDRRIKAITANGTITYYFDEFRFIEERNINEDVQKTYVYGTWLDDVLSYDYLAEPFYIVNDQRGTVLAVLNSIGSPERYEYNAFGDVQYLDSAFISMDSSKINNINAFTGRPYYPFQNIYDYRERVYNPFYGRFNQKDLLNVFDSTQTNLYAYLNNNPVNKLDPFGMFSLNSITDPIREKYKLLQYTFTVEFGFSKGPLADKLLYNYIFNNSRPINLSKIEVLYNLSPNTSLAKSKYFLNDIKSNCLGKFTTFSNKYAFVTHDPHQGGLGDYTIDADVKVNCCNQGDWSAEGTASVKDYWDFDYTWGKLWKEWKNRVFFGRETQTLLGSFISGEPFYVTSESLNISEQSTQGKIDWH